MTWRPAAWHNEQYHVRIEKQDVCCYENPIGCLTHENGQRTSMDCWYFDEDHLWYSFFLAGEHS